jgi:hypothetical protein
MRTLLSLCLALGRAVLMPRATLILENAALRQQLTVYTSTPRLGRDCAPATASSGSCYARCGPTGPATSSS